MNRPTRWSMPAAVASSGDRPTLTISGSVKHTSGTTRSSHVSGHPGDHLGDERALGHRPVGQHRLAGDVADGEHAAHRGAALVVDVHRPAVHRQVQRGRSRRSPGRRPTVTSTASAGRACSLPSASAIVRPRSSPSESAGGRPEQDDDAERLEPGGHRAGEPSSYCGRMRGCTSTTVTSAPSLRYAVPSSRPM